tara:strand:+ start:2610 stop:3884 length:1275 start_codon:yes stop_codon:yes gene_type:complete
MSTNNLPIKFYSFLISIIPIVLITGPFLPDLFLVIVGIGYLGLTYREKEFLDFSNLYLKLFFFVCIYLIILSIVSLNFDSFKSSIFYFRFGLFSLALSFFVFQNPKIIKNLLYIFIIVYFTLFIDTIYQFFYSKNIIGFEYSNPQNFRITSFFGDDEVLGSYTARFFPLFLFLILYSYKLSISKKAHVMISLVTIISFVIVLMSGERTSLALFILVFSFIFFSSKNFRKVLFIPLISIVIVFILTVSLSDKIKNRVLTQTMDQMGLSSKSERLVIFSKTYEGHYLLALKMFKEKPIFGHGPKMFRFYCSKEENKEENFVVNHACSTHPHNFYAQVLAETGIIGLFILLGIFIYISFLFFKNLYFQIIKKQQLISDMAICLLASYFMTLFPFIPSGNFFNNWLSVIVYFPLGFLLYTIKEKKFYV